MIIDFITEVIAWLDIVANCLCTGEQTAAAACNS